MLSNTEPRIRSPPTFFTSKDILASSTVYMIRRMLILTTEVFIPFSITRRPTAFYNNASSITSILACMSSSVFVKSMATEVSSILELNTPRSKTFTACEVAMVL